MLLVACTALGGVLGASVPVAAHAAGTGGIKGLVTASETEAAIAGIEVCARAIVEPPVAEQCAQTNTSGEYEIAALSAGQYEVRFAAPEESELNYFGQFYNGKPTEAEADQVSVSEGVVSAEIDAGLASAGEVRGTVVQTEGKAVSGIHVCALFASTGLVDRCVLSKPDGSYTIARLPSGSYEIEFAGSLDAALGYSTQFYNGVFSRTLATSVEVTAGPTPKEGVDATLQAAGSIAGTVTSASTKAGLAAVRVCASDASIDVERCAETAAGGAYALAGLPPGSYRLYFDPSALGGAYAPQYYDAQPTALAAEPVAVAPGGSVQGIDAVLQGVPVALLKPAIVGRAIEGQTLTFLAGTWTNSPTSLSDEWGRCDVTGAIESCHTIATTPTYTLTSADVGHTIRIREQAANEHGVGAPQYLFSPPSAVVVAPAPAAAPSGTAPAPGPGAGVLSTTASAATTAQLKALLASLLAPRGKGARIGALLKHRGYTVSFRPLIAGRLSIAWYLVPKGAHVAGAKPVHVAGAKPVLVAVGKIDTPASGASKLTVKLTAKGRSLLAQGSQVKLTAKGVLAASGRPSLVATRTFTLKR
ncbi:MAG: carboxypeptidase regulatory-like domain-containing protein [Solirubrobacterales bacterium]